MTPYVWNLDDSMCAWTGCEPPRNQKRMRTPRKGVRVRTQQGHPRAPRVRVRTRRGSGPRTPQERRSPEYRLWRWWGSAAAPPPSPPPRTAARSVPPRRGGGAAGGCVACPRPRYATSPRRCEYAPSRSTGCHPPITGGGANAQGVTTHAATRGGTHGIHSGSE